ncbi:type VII secretion protein [Plantibacter sp. Leaf171]|uniref:WXG100 family type VII secretion target n=1 Tax=unclassified Plantibacter TaxID=2624265 RepID=UPI0006FCE636|nr:MULTISPECIES: WXG100 family type VII secretion target [unclassified Plantibacter]KQM15726.1 type VII secretion protein [Plantibacter sp. Leaf1]KQQ51817.1 type VII secretion protein [Plantibacter sp. Leaf314]KQR58869.1 type VII secretion protein [Plantibacter sp. Leaf171]
MATFQVDSDAVEHASNAVRVTIEQIQSEVARLHAQLAALDGQWTGAAAAAFHGVVERWRGTQRQVEENLGEISRALSVASTQYAEIERANASMFSG